MISKCHLLRRGVKCSGESSWLYSAGRRFFRSPPAHNRPDPRRARARDAVRRLRRHTPHLKAEKIPVFLTIQNTEAVARIVEALRASGLPD